MKINHFLLKTFIFVICYHLPISCGSKLKQKKLNIELIREPINNSFEMPSVFETDLKTSSIILFILELIWNNRWEWTSWDNNIYNKRVMKNLIQLYLDGYYDTLNIKSKVPNNTNIINRNHSTFGKLY